MRRIWHSLTLALLMASGVSFGRAAWAQSPETRLAGDAPEITVVGTHTPVFKAAADGSVSGSFADYIRGIFFEAGVPIRLKVLPPMRAMNQVETTPNTCLLTQYRQRERDRPVAWVFPTYVTVFGLYGLEDQVQALRQMNPRQLKITAVVRDTSAQTASRRGFTIHSPVSKHQQGIRMMRAGRADVIALTSPGAAIFGKGAGVMLQMVVPLGKGVQWFSCHPDLEPKVLQQLRRGFKARYTKGHVHDFLRSIPGMDIEGLEREAQEFISALDENI